MTALPDSSPTPAAMQARPAATVYLPVVTRKASADTGTMTTIMPAAGSTRVPVASALCPRLNCRY